MLLSLHVKNLALIHETEVEFGTGLNILTGETGAGKSILIGSVLLALGAKAEKDLIRSGAEYALVELVFRTHRADVKEKMQELDLSMEEDDTITISRKIQESRSVCKVNGEAVSARICKELAELLIDIHGQHEHQSLLNIRNHLAYLDDYCGEELTPVANQLKEQYALVKTLQEKLHESDVDEETRRKELSLAQFELEQIEEAKLIPGEAEDLERSFCKMENARKITEGVMTAHQYLGYDEQDSAGNQTGRALRELKNVVPYDEKLAEGLSILLDIDGLLNDLNRFLSNYLEELEFDEETFMTCEHRLNQINQLRSRYGSSIEDILEYAQKQQERIDKLKNFDEYRERISQEYEKEREKLLSLCESVSVIRRKYALQLSQQLRQALIDLNFLHVEFGVEVRTDQNRISGIGFDEVEFMISTNPGEPMRPLKQIASGGELSRIMLAIKSVFARKDEIETLIFDEIDSGISGKTAWKVSKKLGELSRSHQIICITHLPQIAANADNHYLIEKRSDGKVTRTDLTRLSEDESIAELARMLGGETMTETVLDNAREIRRQAKSS